MESQPAIVERLKHKIRHYHGKASRCRVATLVLKTAQIVIAGTIPVLALVDPRLSKPAVNGVLGAMIVIIEGFQHSFKFDTFWIRYRHCAYQLESEQSLYANNAGPYRAESTRLAVLAERVEKMLMEQMETWEATVERVLKSEGQDSRQSLHKQNSN